MSAEDERHRRDDESMPVVLHRLTQLESRVEAGFRHIDDRLDGLSFVRSDVYAAETADRDRRISSLETKLAPGGEVQQDIASAASPGKWALNLMITAFVVAMVGGLVTLALQGGGG